MLDLLFLFATLLHTGLRRHGELVAENLLLRHQLAVLTRPTRRRRVRSGSVDKLLWVLLHRLRCDWRRHLVVVTPGTVIRWHRPGWRRLWDGNSSAASGGAPAHVVEAVQHRACPDHLDRSRTRA